MNFLASNALGFLGTWQFLKAVPFRERDDGRIPVSKRGKEPKVIPVHPYPKTRERETDEMRGEDKTAV